MALAKLLFEKLKEEPVCRTAIELKVLKKAGTHATFEGIFKWLHKSGYIEKSSLSHRSNYRITEKGLKLLEALQ